MKPRNIPAVNLSWRSRLRARTIAIPDPGQLTAFLPATGGTAFLRGDEGIIAIGEVARFITDSLDAADIWWQNLSSSIENESEMPGRPGTGPVAVGSFAFDPDRSSEPSVLIVPEVVVGRREGQAWLTRITVGDKCSDELPPRHAIPRSTGEVTISEGALSASDFARIVQHAVELIRAGELSKVVLVRDLLATSDAPFDARVLVRRLVATQPGCWTFLVDGLVGATPEMLVRLTGRLAESRVLAGTLARTADDAADLGALLTSAKDRSEHDFAVSSVADALQPYCEGVHVSGAPYVLMLPSILHLATDITGVAQEAVSSLALAAALHPSAAVCGTPTHVARDLIAELEEFDRGRYAGPVGWIDAQGNGEWALAMRCGQLDAAIPDRLHLFAGCGIVADSDPAAEVAESMAKFGPMLRVLEDASPVS